MVVFQSALHSGPRRPDRSDRLDAQSAQPTLRWHRFNTQQNPRAFQPVKRIRYQRIAADIEESSRYVKARTADEPRCRTLLPHE